MTFQIKKHHQRYSAYQDTQIPWLGEVPKEWAVRKVKTLGKLLAGGTPKTNEESYWNGDIPWLPSGAVQNCVISENKKGKTITLKGLTESAAKLISPNAPLVALTGATCGNVALLKFKATANQSVVALEPNKRFSAEFLHYCYLANREQFLFYQTGGAQGGINLSNVKNTTLSIPCNKKEQTAIANYLDEKTELIDQTLIAKKKQIELLKEKRSSLINRAVTRGIEDGVEIIDSGVEWIGEVPKGWVVSKLGKLTSKVNSGVTPKGGAESYLDEGIPLIRSLNVYSDGFRWKNLAYIGEETYQKMSNSKVRKGDVLLNITGASIGRCYFYSGEFQKANVNQHVCILRSSKKIKSRFLHYFLISRSGQDQIFVVQMGTSREGLNYQQIKRFDICLPDPMEQEKIIDYLDIETSKIDQTITLVEKSISLLEEYKTSLISNVVTGKIKVCNQLDK